MSGREAFVVHTEAESFAGTVEVILTVDLPEGVHIEPHEPPEPYLVPTVLEADGLDEVEVVYPKPVIKDLGWNDVTLTVLEGSLTFRVRGRMASGTDRVRGTLSYQPCVGGACLPARSIRWESPVEGTTAYSVLRAVAA